MSWGVNEIAFLLFVSLSTYHNNYIRRRLWINQYRSFDILFLILKQNLTQIKTLMDALFKTRVLLTILGHFCSSCYGFLFINNVHWMAQKRGSEFKTQYAASLTNESRNMFIFLFFRHSSLMKTLLQTGKTNTDRSHYAKCVSLWLDTGSSPPATGKSLQKKHTSTNTSRNSCKKIKF